MATYRDPVRVFAPLEVIERLLEIRAEAGYAPAITSACAFVRDDASPRSTNSLSMRSRVIIRQK